MTRPVPINVISVDAESFLFGRVTRCTTLHRIRSLPELRAVLDQRLADPSIPGSTTLDLMGHSTREHHHLRIGDTPVDLLDPAVERFFAALAADEVLPRLNVRALRLLGCETAVEVAGQRTVARLARLLNVKVYGSRKPLMKSHYDARGFVPAFAAGALIEASELPSPPRRLGA